MYLACKRRVYSDNKSKEVIIVLTTRVSKSQSHYRVAPVMSCAGVVYRKYPPAANKKIGRHSDVDAQTEPLAFVSANTRRMLDYRV